jgi:DNA-binding transcriptional regulator GbsR (MarR family)
VNFLRQRPDVRSSALDAVVKTGASSVGFHRQAALTRRALSATQRQIVQVCELSVQQLGLSRSVGQIFGVIYCSPRPLAFGDVAGILDISKGSVSQGLRFLRELGAIKLVEVSGDRRELYAAEIELRSLIAEVLQTRLREPLESGSARLRALTKQLKASDEPDREFLNQRLASLQAWHRKALLILPLIQRILGPDRG